MRTILLSTALAALIALGTLPAVAAEGPGHDAPGANGLGITLQVDYDGRWQDPNQPDYGNPDWNRDWHDPDSYNQPSWGWGNNGWGNNGYDQYQYRQPLPKWVIRHKLARQNFHDFSHWRFKNGYYRINAEDWRGRDVRLIVDAYNGRILQVERR